MTGNRENQLNPATGGCLGLGTQKNTLTYTKETVMGPVTDTRCPCPCQEPDKQNIAQVSSCCYSPAVFRRSRTLLALSLVWGISQTPVILTISLSAR